jgi:hypothetical protein
MRWLILLPALPGALLGGLLGEHLGLRWSLGSSNCAGVSALLLAAGRFATPAFMRGLLSGWAPGSLMHCGCGWVVGFGAPFGWGRIG